MYLDDSNKVFNKPSYTEKVKHVFSDSSNALKMAAEAFDISKAQLQALYTRGRGSKLDRNQLMSLFSESPIE